MPLGPCVVCDIVNYPLSFGGPSICPSCDSGTTYKKNGTVYIQIPLSEYKRLRGERDET